MTKRNVTRLKVQICGSDYLLRGDASEDHLREVAQKVDAVMQRIIASSPHLDQKRAAVLTAVNLADELFRLRLQYESLLELVDEQTNSSSGQNV